MGSGEGPRALAFELPGGVTGLVLRFLRGFPGCELLALLFSLSLLLLVGLERLELLLSLLLFLLLDLLSFLGLLCEKDLDDKDPDAEYDLLWSDVGEVACLAGGVLVRALLEGFGSTCAGAAPAVVSSATGGGGPGG